MLVKLVDKEKTLTEVDINGVTYPVRWEIDDTGNAVLAVTRVDGLGYDESTGLYQVETQKNVDTFYKTVPVLANTTTYAYLNEMQYGNTTLIDVSKYKSIDLIISCANTHDFEFATSGGFRNISQEFGAFFTMNLADISDIYVKTSTEHDAKTNNNGSNKKYIYVINLRVVQSLFSIAISNKTATDQNYNIELRAHKG